MNNERSKMNSYEISVDRDYGNDDAYIASFETDGDARDYAVAIFQTPDIRRVHCANCTTGNEIVQLSK